MIREIRCSRCGRINEYDDDNDVVLCEECEDLIFVETEQ
jgi:DNA-directed RNA polymerase subunit RPC12/RpoP